MEAGRFVEAEAFNLPGEFATAEEGVQRAGFADRNPSKSMSLIYLTADDRNLGEMMDLQIIQQYLGPGEVSYLSYTAQRLRYRYRRDLVRRIRGQVPIVAGGGTLMSYFSAFWDAIADDQKFLFVGTGVCWSYGKQDAIHIDARHVDSRSRFRGPVLPLGFSTRECILPPGILYKIKRKAPAYVLSALHPKLVDAASQHQFATEVARRMGLPLVESTNAANELALYEETALVVASRLHSAVLAAGNGIPCFVLSRDHKIDWFCNQVGMEYASLPNRLFGKLPDTVAAMAAASKPIDAADKLLLLDRYLSELARSLSSEESGLKNSHQGKADPTTNGRE